MAQPHYILTNTQNKYYPSAQIKITQQPFVVSKPTNPATRKSHINIYSTPPQKKEIPQKKPLNCQSLKKYH